MSFTKEIEDKIAEVKRETREGQCPYFEDDDFYFVEADYKRSWLMRSDNAQLDKNKMKYNSEKYMIPWKDGDEKYL